MARTSTYLHFGGNAEEAFAFYKAAFGTEFVEPIERMGDLPAQPGQPELSAEEKNQVASVKLPIAGGHLLVGNDAPAWMGTLVHGNAMDIGVELDSHAEAERIFAALSEGANPSPKAPTSNTPSRKCSTATTSARWSTSSAPNGWSVAPPHPSHLSTPAARPARPPGPGVSIG
jgi:PhnB protein